MNDSVLLDQFESLTLPFTEWTHRTHVKVAYLYLSRHEFADALDQMRRGVKAYNAANDVPEGEFTGYNETTTSAFMHLIDSVRVAYGDAKPVNNADAFCDMHPQLMSRHALRFFYSPERRMHPDSKETFIEPDLTTLPRGR